MGLRITRMWGALLHNLEFPCYLTLNPCGVFPQAAVISSHDLLLRC